MRSTNQQGQYLAKAIMNYAAGRTAAWGDNDSRPELQTLRGQFLRTILILCIAGIWVVGIGGTLVLWGLSLWSIGRWVVLKTPIPFYVELFLSLMALYEGYHYATRSSHRQWPWMRQLLCHVFKQYPYFRLSVTVFEERIKNKASDTQAMQLATMASKAVEKNDLTCCVPPNDHALFAFHPHGVLSCGWSIGGVQHGSFDKADCRWMVAESLFYFPFMRELMHWLSFASAGKTAFRTMLRTGQNVCLMPGGFEEATLYERGKHRVYIKQRFGFIKLALQHGYKVYPVYTFGEEYAYHTFSYLLNFRLRLNDYKLPGVLFYGRPACFFLPRSDVDLITVVGAPLLLPRIEHPTREDVRKYHGQYVTALQALFDRYKAVYAVDPKATLEVF